MPCSTLVCGRDSDVIEYSSSFMSAINNVSLSTVNIIRYIKLLIFAFDFYISCISASETEYK